MPSKKNTDTSSNAQPDISKLGKLSLPGVAIKEILEIEEFFPTLRRSLSIVLYFVSIIAQVRLKCANMNLSQFTMLESVRTYNKLVLAKSEPMLTVAAAVAIKRTLAAHAPDPDGSRITAAIQDLIENPTGPSSTKENMRAALVSEERLRKLRRGLMLKTTGQIQAAGAHNPKGLGPAIPNLIPQNFLSALPYESDITIEELVTAMRELFPIEPGFEFADAITIDPADQNLVPLEKIFNVKRMKDGVALASLQLPADITNLPAWKKNAITQAKRLKGE